MIRFAPVTSSDEDAGFDNQHVDETPLANFFSAAALRAQRISNGSGSPDAPMPMTASSGSSSSSAMNRSTRTCGSTPRRRAAASSFAASSSALIVTRPLYVSAPNSKEGRRVGVPRGHAAPRDQVSASRRSRFAATLARYCSTVIVSSVSPPCTPTSSALRGRISGYSAINRASGPPRSASFCRRCASARISGLSMTLGGCSIVVQAARWSVGLCAVLGSLDQCEHIRRRQRMCSHRRRCSSGGGGCGRVARGFRVVGGRGGSALIAGR